MRRSLATLLTVGALLALPASCYWRPGTPAAPAHGNGNGGNGVEALDVSSMPAVEEADSAAAALGPAVPAWRPAPVEGVRVPRVQREFRGVWVATVGNMDWPSRNNLSTAEAQQELLRILDAARDHGLNAVIFQIRPMADAFYASDLEPWSDYLTGASGVAPDPFWDPLQFAIEQAHARGLELHAWFNPFRAGFVAKRAPLSTRHVTRRRPELVRRYGRHWWMDPGEPAARQLALNVMVDVAQRYDVDGIHIDDYFYPYQERDARGRIIPFPDDATWSRYGRASGMNRNDWRRSNVDAFVETLYAAVRAVNPHVRVGISPFGIWRPGHPESVRGLDAWNDLYADSRKWLLNGWADYYVPQLYWRTAAPQQPYTDLLHWWTEQNPHGRHIWAGNIPNSVADGNRGWSASEILEQVRLTRQHPGATGNIHFSASSLLRNPDGLGEAFRTTLYATRALPPATPWLGSGPDEAPIVRAEPDSTQPRTLVVMTGATERPRAWLVHARWDQQWHTRILTGATRETAIDWRDGAPPDAIAIVAVDRVGVESVPALLVLEHVR